MGLVTSRVAKEMPVILNNAAQNLAILSGKANNEALNSQRKTTEIATDMRDNAKDEYTYTQFDSIRRISIMREELISKQNQLNSSEKAGYEALIQSEQAVRGIIEQRAQALTLVQQEVESLKEAAALEAAMNVPESDKIWQQSESEVKAGFEKRQQRYAELSKKAKINRGASLTDDDFKELKMLEEEMKNLDESIPMATFDKYVEKAKEAISRMGEFSEAQGMANKRVNEFNKFTEKEYLQTYSEGIDKLKFTVENWKNILPNTTQYTELLDEALKALGDSSLPNSKKMEKVAEVAAKIAQAQNEAAESSRNLANAEAQKIAKQYNISPEALAKIQAIYRKQGYDTPGVYDQGSKDPQKIGQRYTT